MRAHATTLWHMPPTLFQRAHQKAEYLRNCERSLRYMFHLDLPMPAWIAIETSDREWGVLQRRLRRR